MQDSAIKAGSLDASLLARKGAAHPSAVGRPARTAPPPPPRHGRPEPGKGNRIRLSLRLDEDRHTALRLAAAQRGCSMQTLLVAALDEHLAALEAECPCLRRRTSSPDARPEDSDR